MMKIDEVLAAASGRLAAGEEVEQVLRWVAQAAYRAGLVAQTGELLTVDQVAAELGIVPRTVRQLAQHRGVGLRVEGGNRAVWLFTPADLEALRERKVGRPKKPKPADREIA